MLRYLMQLMRYDDAIIWLQKYREAITRTCAPEGLIKGCSGARSMLDAMPPGVAILLPFNTDGSDFAPTLWKAG